MSTQNAPPVLVAKASRATSRVLLVAALFLPRVALAGPSEADATLAQGLTLFRQHDYEAARVAFAQSYVLAPRTATLLDLALAELNSAHPLEAAKHLRIFVLSADAPSDRVEDVRTKMLPRAEAQIGRVQIDAPSGAQVQLDGAALGTSPFSEPVEVMPGVHELTAVFATGRRARMTVNAVAGQLSLARIVSEEPFVAPVTSNAPPPPSAVPQQDAISNATWSTAKTATVIALGAGAVASIGIGTVFVLLANSDKNDAANDRVGLGAGACTPVAGKSLPPSCSLLDSATNAQATHASLANGFYVGGATLALGAVATWLLWPSSKPGDSRAWAAPVVGRSTGLQIGTSF